MNNKKINKYIAEIAKIIEIESDKQNKSKDELINQLILYIQKELGK